MKNIVIFIIITLSVQVSHAQFSVSAQAGGGANGQLCYLYHIGRTNLTDDMNLGTSYTYEVSAIVGYKILKRIEFQAALGYFERAFRYKTEGITNRNRFLSLPIRLKFGSQKPVYGLFSYETNFWLNAQYPEVTEHVTDSRLNNSFRLGIGFTLSEKVQIEFSAYSDYLPYQQFLAFGNRQAFYNYGMVGSVSYKIF